MNGLSDFLSKYGNLIIYTPTIIFIIVLLFNILNGLRRGLRKSLILLTISAVCFLVSYLLFIFVLKKPFFESFILDTYAKIKGETLNETLDISNEYTRFKTIISAFVDKKVNKDAYVYFSPYVEALSECILGFVYMIFTFIIWSLIYFFIGYLIVYLIFFREGKYRQKLEGRASEDSNEQSEEESSIPQEDENQADEKKTSPYKRRRLLGSLVGLFKGIIFGMLVISVFGIIFYVSTGLKTDVYEKGDTVTVSVNGKDYDLTDIYKFVYEYDNSGVNKPFNRIKVNGVPVYASVPNMFCNAKLKVSEDGINTKIYPMNELAALMAKMHEGVQIIDKYEISFDKDTIVEDLNALAHNQEFIDDVYDYVNSFVSTRLHRALGKTVTKHFADIITSTVNNKYVDIVFKGEHAINIDDIGSRDDLKQFVNIASKCVVLYKDYKDVKDVKDVIINQCDHVNDLTDEILKLSIFSADDKSNLNGCISDLMEEALNKNDTLKDISFANISWFGNSGQGEVAKFIKSLTRFLNSNLLVYEDQKIKFNVKNIADMFTAAVGKTSIMDDLKDSTAIRRVISKVIIDTNIDGKSLYIPNSCLDSDGTILVDEYENLFESLTDLITAMDFSDLPIVELKDIVSTVVPEIVDDIQSNKQLAEYVTQSNVLTSIASKYLYDKVSETYVVPEDLVLDDAHIDTNIYNWMGTTGELYKLLRAVTIVGNVDDLSANVVFKLTDEDIYDLASSRIINSVITKEIQDVTLDNIELIILPEAYDGAYLAVSEITGMMHTLKAISKYDTLTDEEKAAFDISDISINASEIISDNNIRNSLFNSIIIEATVSNKIATMTTEGLVIPTDLQVTATDKSNLYNWIGNNGELKAFVDGINDLGIASQITETTSNIDVNTVLESANIEGALASKVIWYTLSANINDKISTNADIQIPSIAYEENTLIKKSEIISLFDSIVELEKGMENKDIANIDSNMVLTGNVDMSVVLASNIVWYSVSKAFINTTAVTVPYASYQDYAATEKYLLKSEIINTIDILKILNQSDIDNISIDSETVLAFTDENLNKLLASFVAWYKLSDEIITNTINMPTNVIYNDKHNNYVTKSEIIALVHAFKVINITDLTSYSVEANTVIDLSADNKNTLLESYIVWYAISDNIVTEATTNADIHIPTAAYETSSTIIKKVEIISLLDAVAELEKDMVNKDLANVENNLILTGDMDLDILLESYIVWYSVSTSFIGTTGVTIPYASYLDYAATEKYLIKAEIENTIAVLKLMNQTDISNIVLDSAIILAFSDENLNIVLSSYVSWYELSDEIITNSAHLPTLDVVENDGHDNYINQNEVIALVHALNVINVYSLSSYVISSSAIIGLSEDDRSTLLASYIVWHEISYQIINSNTFVITVNAIDDYDVQEVYLRTDEIDSILCILEIMGASDFSSADINPKTIVDAGGSVYVYSSHIMCATITETLFYDNQVAIYNPDSAMEVQTIYNSTDTMYVYKADETRYLIEGLAALNANYTSGLTFDIMSYNSLDSTQRANVVGSYTLWKYTSELIDTYQNLIGEPVTDRVNVVVMEYNGNQISTSNDSAIDSEYIAGYHPY